MDIFTLIVTVFSAVVAGVVESAMGLPMAAWCWPFIAIIWCISAMKDRV